MAKKRKKKHKGQIPIGILKKRLLKLSKILHSRTK